jgi:type I restriction enzyme, S subunit
MTEIGRVPESWDVVRFDEVLDFKGGGQPEKSTFVYEPTPNYVRLLQIRDFESDNHPAYIRCSDQRSICTKEDVLVARYGASLGRVLTGKAGAYNVALVKFMFDYQRVAPRWLFHWLSSPAFQIPLFQIGSRSAQAGFNKEDLAPVLVALPTISEQLQLSAEVDSAGNASVMAGYVCQSMSKVRAGLADDLLSGRVRVPA